MMTILLLLVHKGLNFVTFVEQIHNIY